MAISRSLMNRQLRADGGIMQVAPREKFGLGSKLKKFVRKIIPNEVADIAVKAAPFVAPFNPAVAAAMSGLGTFDQTGSIGKSLKGGALTYGLGQGARYLGGAGFQGNPFSADGGAFRGGLEGLKGGFTSPLGNQTGFKLGQPIGEVQGVASEPLKVSTFADDVTQEMLPGQIQIIDKTAVAKEPGFLKNLFDGVSNQDYGKVAQTIGDGAKKFGKAMFTNKDGSIDKAAVMGAITFAASYAEALALANDAGIELTEEEYNEARKDEKKEEYAGYLTNFFGGVKDGGRIGFESGANEMIKTQLLEEIMPNTDTTTEDFVMIMTEDGPKMVLRSQLPSESMMMDTTTSVFGDAGRGRRIPEELRADGGRIGFKDGTDDDAFEELDNIRALVDTLMREEDISESEAYEKVIKKLYAKGGRVSRKFGSPEKGESEIGIMAIDVEAGDDEDMEDDMMMAGGINFSRAEKAYLFKRLGGAGGSDRSYTMPSLYRILNNPNRYPRDARILKEIVNINLGEGQKDGGRIGYAKGANRVSELLILRDEKIGKGEDVSDIEAEIFQLTGKTFRSVGGISDVPTGKIRKNSAGVVERDYRDEGGFVPVGIKERADDVPAMLSKNEFVMTADAVRGIGNGSVEEGSKKLYNTMKQAEKVGKA